jgi:hypothetical protein
MSTVKGLELRVTFKLKVPVTVTVTPRCTDSESPAYLQQYQQDEFTLSVNVMPLMVMTAK